MIRYDQPVHGIQQCSLYEPSDLLLVNFQRKKGYWGWTDGLVNFLAHLMSVFV